VRGEEAFTIRLRRAERAAEELEHGHPGDSMRLTAALELLRAHARAAYGVGDIAGIRDALRALQEIEGETESRIARERSEFGPRPPLR